MIRSKTSARASRDTLIAALFIVCAIAPVGVCLAVLPAGLVMPSLSALLIFIAAVASVLAWTCGSPRHGDALTIWDVAGAFAFLGCAAAIFSRPDSVLRLIEHAYAP